MKTLNASNAVLERKASRSRPIRSVVRCTSERSDNSIQSTNAVSSSRRGALVAGAMLPIFGITSTFVVSPSLAYERPQLSADTKVFLDIKVDGKPLGRVVIALFDDVKIGAQRFLELAKGVEGVSLRGGKFEEIAKDEYVINTGLRSLTYSANGEIKLTGGDSASEELEPELLNQTRRHDQAGLVSLFVRDAEEREVKERLIARDGKLVTVVEEQGPGAPNGTAFAISLKAQPEFDRTNLIVGRVVEGYDVVKAISELKAVKDNSSSPYFQVAKAIGDKRAVVAERGFSRPFARVTIGKSGIVG